MGGQSLGLGGDRNDDALFDSIVLVGSDQVEHPNSFPIYIFVVVVQTRREGIGSDALILVRGGGR